VNILSSLLCKRYGAKMSFTLINKGRSYGPLVSSLGVDVVINPREMTVSSILQHIRKGKVLAAHSICGGVAEIVEVEVQPQSAIVDKSVADLHLPRGVRVGAILRDGEVLIPDDKTIIALADRIVLLSITSQLGKVDRIFSASLEYF
jgi:trk system potassium uptake protein TrkA